MPEPAAVQPLTRLPDGTVKQVNPFTGTQVWTVPGRADRPLVAADGPAEPIDAAADGRHCAFCEQRYLETTPERERVVRRGTGWESIPGLPADRLHDTVADFRLVPNLFEILSYDYWTRNHGFRPPARVQRQQQDYLATPAGREHVGRLLELRGFGQDDLAEAARFFAGSHDVVVARRHFVDGAVTTDQLASSGTLTPDEHARYIDLTVRAMLRIYEDNPHVVYASTFQNWLRPAGASFDHLHKQIVGVDEVGTRLNDQLARLRRDPDLHERWGPPYLASQGLVVARNEHAVAVAGVGHRYPSLEVWSLVKGRPWELPPEVLRDVSDLLQAMHAAMGSRLPCNEEWQHQPPAVSQEVPLRVVLKWRIATLAGFEGGTRIFITTLDPWQIRDRVVAELRPLQARGAVADFTVGDDALL